MILSEIVDATALLLGRDTEETKQEITQHIHNLRAKYVKQHFDKSGMTDWMMQSVIAPLHKDLEYCNFGCEALQVQLDTIPIRGTDLIVTTLSGDVIQGTTKEKVKMQQYEKYTKNVVRYVLENNKIVIIGNHLLKAIRLKAAFEYPHKLNAMTECVNCGIQDDYPLFIDYIPTIQQEIVNLYVREKQQPETNLQRI